MPIRAGLKTYLSLKPAAPFPLTEITASSKLHDEAALTAVAPSSRAEGSNERRSFMVGVVLCDAGIPSRRARRRVLSLPIDLNTFLRGVAVATAVDRLAPSPFPRFLLSEPWGIISQLIGVTFVC